MTGGKGYIDYSQPHSAQEIATNNPRFNDTDIVAATKEKRVREADPSGGYAMWMFSLLMAFGIGVVFLAEYFGHFP